MPDSGHELYALVPSGAGGSCETVIQLHLYSHSPSPRSSVMATALQTEVIVSREDRPALTHIVDVDRPRPEEECHIDWVKLGCAVKRKVKRVKDLLYNDDRADLAEIINNYGPADIDLHGRTGAISITGVLAESEQYEDLLVGFRRSGLSH